MYTAPGNLTLRATRVIIKLLFTDLICKLAAGICPALTSTLSCDFAYAFNETLKWLTQLPTFMQNQSGGDSVTSRC